MVWIDLQSLTESAQQVWHRDGIFCDFHAVCCARTIDLTTANAATGQERGQHEWLIELRSGVTANVTPAGLASDLDVELQRLNDDYEAKRLGGGLAPPSVRRVSGSDEMSKAFISGVKIRREVFP